MAANQEPLWPKMILTGHEAEMYHGLQVHRAEQYGRTVKLPPGRYDILVITFRDWIAYGREEGLLPWLT